MCLAVPGRIERTWSDRGTPMATVDFGGVHKDICLAYAPDATTGQYALVHAGFAISLVDEAQASETLRLLAEIGEIEARTEPA